MNRDKLIWAIVRMLQAADEEKLRELYEVILFAMK